LILLECGGVFPLGGADFKLRAELLIKSMDQMGYTAMNLGGNDLYAGTDFLKELTADADFPLLSSNLVFKDARAPFWKKYVITDLGDMKAGIVGIIPFDGFKNITDQTILKNLEILPPKSALAELIPAVRKEADVIILLSQCSLDETASILNTEKHIDFAIYSGETGGGCRSRSALQNSPVKLLHSTRHGMNLGYLEFTLADGQIIQNEKKMIALNTPVPAEKLMSDMFDEIRKLRAEKENREMQEEARALLKLSPEEYMQKLLKEKMMPDAGYE
jgi:2',3'-cyclic-nucleotide 2'-phosphodiesterase (5'-nucleotidase family)